MVHQQRLAAGRSRPTRSCKIPYDVKKDFAFITLVVRVPEVLAVHPSLPANSLPELITYAKANPGKVNFGSAGQRQHHAPRRRAAQGRSEDRHRARALQRRRAGGERPARRPGADGDLRRAGAARPHPQRQAQGARHHQRDARARAAGSRRPLPSSATRTSIRTTGTAWSMAAATPPDIQSRVHAAAVAALKSKAVDEQFAKVGGIASPGTPQEYAALHRRRAGEVVEDRHRHRLQGID